MGIDCYKVEMVGDNTVKYNDHYVINVYELCNKCKEWAWENKFIVASFKNKFGWYASVDTYDDNPREAFKGDTEEEMVFAVCEWVLDELR